MNAQSNRFTFFFPNVRVLSAEEIQRLSPEKKQAAEKTGAKGVWLDVHCPDAACISDQGFVTIPAAGVDVSGKKGVWLKLFCPEDTCEIGQSTDLP